MPTPGPKSIAGLSTKDIHGLMRSLARPGTKREALAPASRRPVHSILHKAMDDAVEYEWTARNPVSKKEKPKKGDHHTGDALTQTEANALLAAARGDRLEAIVTMALMIGSSSRPIAPRTRPVLSAVDKRGAPRTLHRRRVQARAATTSTTVTTDPPDTSAS